MLQRSLDETDPETTDVIVMTAKTTPVGDAAPNFAELDRYDRKLMTAVIELAEKAGKRIIPMVVPTNNPLYAVMNTAKSLGAQELVVGASNKFTAEEQLDQMAFYWISLNEGRQVPLTIRVLSRNWDVHYDVAGGNRIPRISERKARSVGELRAAGVGVRRVLMAHDNTPHSCDLFDTVITALDPDVVFDLAHVPSGRTNGGEPITAASCLTLDIEQAHAIGREVAIHTITGDPGVEIVRLVKDNEYDLLVLEDPAASDDSDEMVSWTRYIRDHVSCTLCLLSRPAIPREVVDSTPSTVIASADRNPAKR
jgi:hypothetical protein